MAALKGAGWSEGKGKGKSGKGKKGGKGMGWSNYGKFAGKSAGKSLNYWRGDDYYDAWGSEEYQYVSYYECYNDGGYVGNVIMMLEVGEEEQTDDSQDDSTQLNSTIDGAIEQVTTKSIGEWDPLRIIQKTTPIEIEYRYELLYESDDDEDDDGVAIELDATTIVDDDQDVNLLHNNKRRPNQRQRRR